MIPLRARCRADRTGLGSRENIAAMGGDRISLREDHLRGVAKKASCISCKKGDGCRVGHARSGLLQIKKVQDASLLLHFLYDHPQLAFGYHPRRRFSVFLWLPLRRHAVSR